MHVQESNGRIFKKLLDDVVSPFALDDIRAQQHIMPSNARIDSKRLRSISGSVSRWGAAVVTPFRT